MRQAVTERTLDLETAAFRGTGGVSAENRHCGFRPAFLDADTERVYRSCFADGRPAPFHLLDGLPDELVLARSACGRVTSVKASIVSGFMFEGRFYTREDAAMEICRRSLAETRRKAG